MPAYLIRASSLMCSVCISIFFSCPSVIVAGSLSPSFFNDSSGYLKFFGPDSYSHYKVQKIVLVVGGHYHAGGHARVQHELDGIGRSRSESIQHEPVVETHFEAFPIPVYGAFIGRLAQSRSRRYFQHAVSEKASQRTFIFFADYQRNPFENIGQLLSVGVNTVFAYGGIAFL
jgi:hypothetical protein